MSIHQVDIEHLLHTCPAEPDAHPYDIRRTLVHVVSGGPCRAPVTIRIGDLTTTIPCGRHEPAGRQCSACRMIVTERTITTRHLDEVAA